MPRPNAPVQLLGGSVILIKKLGLYVSVKVKNVIRIKESILHLVSTTFAVLHQVELNISRVFVYNLPHQ